MRFKIASSHMFKSFGKRHDYRVHVQFFFDPNRKYHDTRVSMNSDEHHKSEGGLLKPMIFGGLDGILTSFAIVAGAAGGNLSSGVVLILGFSNILADALAMGVGEFLSSKAENEWILSERRREEWELENYPEGERREMVELYMDKGMSREDAENVIETLAKYKDFFVDIMMTQELGLQVPEEDHVTESIREGALRFSWQPKQTAHLPDNLIFPEGVIMFASFAFFGALPLIGYVVFPSVFPTLSENQLFVCACAVTGFVLFFLGSVKSRFW